MQITRQAVQLNIRVEKLLLKKPFRISGYEFIDSDVVVVEVDDGTHRGIGEASGVYYLNDGPPEMLEMLERHRETIESGVSRAEVQQLLPPCGARNALDCALWDLEAKQKNVPVWELAGLEPPRPLLTTFSLSASNPKAMAQEASEFPGAKAIKIKLTGELEVDVSRVDAVRAAMPEAWIGVDANQGYQANELAALVKELAKAGVSLLEQPLRRGQEHDLLGKKYPMAIAADESALSLSDLPRLIGLFDVVNIKLDKCGGMTEGLAIARRAKQLGLRPMVGNMIGSSRANAPAFLVGQLCEIVDLDGPYFIAEDRPIRCTYRDGHVHCAEDVWGAATA